MRWNILFAPSAGRVSTCPASRPRPPRARRIYEAMKLLAKAGAGFFVVALALAPTGPPAAAGTYSQVVVFGDSLSDQGNTETAFGYPPLPPYANGRYSDGQNWVDIFGQQLGVKVGSSLGGGTNYAYGFATTGPQDQPPPLPFTTQRIDQQEQAYLKSVHHKADPAALYVLEAGATDILGLLFAAQTDPLLLLFIPTLDQTGTANVTAETRALLRAGAKHVLVSNVPNLGLLPIVTEQSGLGGIIAPSVATDAAQLWDDDLSDGIVPLTKSGKVTLWDFYNTGAMALAGASQFGITNTTTECVTGYGTTLGVVDQCTPQAERTHLFFDQVHFTGTGYFGMEQGAICALGGTTVFGWSQSSCIVTRSSLRSHGHPAPPGAFRRAYRSAVLRGAAR